MYVVILIVAVAVVSAPVTTAVTILTHGNRTHRIVIICIGSSTGDSSGSGIRSIVRISWDPRKFLNTKKSSQIFRRITTRSGPKVSPGVLRKYSTDDHSDNYDNYEPTNRSTEQPINR
eukprot:7475410-Pyramimonas_sp.AAC.1